jgi:hypothetical protein
MRSRGAFLQDVLQFPDDDAGNARVRAMLERLVFVC